MQPSEIRDTIIKPKLEEIFGKAIGNLLLTTGVLACMGIRSEEEKYKKMIQTICSEPEVISMWGEAGARKQMNEWLDLI